MALATMPAISETEYAPTLIAIAVKIATRIGT